MEAAQEGQKRNGKQATDAVTQVPVERTETKNGAALARGVVKFEEPYTAEAEIRGVAPILFHRYDIEAVESKGAAKKGSKEKKTDNVESYVYRVPGTDEIGVPGLNIKAAICHAARFVQDPRSPRKSAIELFEAGLLIPGIISFGKSTWDYLDKRPVLVQRARVARTRPALNEGWELKFQIQVLLPEYISRELLHEVLQNSGRFSGLGDYRPDFGRFAVTSFKIL